MAIIVSLKPAWELPLQCSELISLIAEWKPLPFYTVSYLLSHSARPLKEPLESAIVSGDVIGSYFVSLSCLLRGKQATVLTSNDKT